MGGELRARQGSSVPGGRANGWTGSSDGRRHRPVQPVSPSGEAAKANYSATLKSQEVRVVHVPDAVRRTVRESALARSVPATCMNGIEKRIVYPAKPARTTADVGITNIRGQWSGTTEFDQSHGHASAVGAGCVSRVPSKKEAVQFEI